MSILHAIILGIVQGITEFLPISSSGHLIIFPELLGWEHQGIDFDVTIHLATLCAVIFVLRDDVINIARGLFSKKHDKDGILGWKIIVATLPVVFLGLFLADDVLEQFRTIKYVGIMLIVWGVVLWIADAYAARRKTSTKQIENVSWVQAIVAGCFQMFALIPGTSRSGSTISGGLFSGLDRPTAARFSFLLAIPSIAGAGVMVFIETIQSGAPGTPFLSMLFGFVAAFISGSLAIRFMLALIQKISYGWFAAYRIILGIILLIIAL